MRKPWIAASSSKILPCFSRDDCSVRGHPAARGQYALRSVHPSNVFRAGLDSDENNALAVVACFFCIVGREHDLANGGAGRGGKSLPDDLVGKARGIGESGMQQLIQMPWLDELFDSGLLVDQTFGQHVDGAGQGPTAQR